MSNDEIIPPQIFISGVIYGLEAYHIGAREILRSYDWEPVWIEDGQIFSRGELRQKIWECEAVVCLVGVRYGVDAPVGPDKAESLAQLEFEIAWELDKPVSIFLFPDAFAFVGDEPESAERRALQRTWRERLVANHRCVHVEDLDDFVRKLEAIILEPPPPRPLRMCAPPSAIDSESAALDDLMSLAQETKSIPEDDPFESTVLRAQDISLGEEAESHKECNLRRDDEPAAIGFKDSVQFTAYQPRSVMPTKWATMLVFAHLDERPRWLDEDELGPIEQMEEEAERRLGSQAADYGRTSSDSSAIPQDGEITFVPEIGGIEFNPPRRSFLWKDGITVHQESFDLRANISLEGRIATGRLTVFLAHLIIAEITLSIRVDTTRGSTATRNRKHESKTAQPFRRVFASYSRRDLEIVEATERYGRALGDEYIRDLLYLRSGEMWNSQLQELIRWADVFQLFWSENSARSPFVENEWRYALSLSRPTFVRPTYWQEPMPEPPEPLRDIHFHRLVPEVSLAEAAAKPSEPTEVILPMAKPTHDAVFMPAPPKQTRAVPRDAMFMPSRGENPNIRFMPSMKETPSVSFKRQPPALPPIPPNRRLVRVWRWLLGLATHPLLRIAPLKYSEGSIEQTLVLRFLNARRSAEGFGSEGDYVSDDSAFAMWVRDARSWAEEILRMEPQTCAAMFEAAGDQALQEVRQLFLRELGAQPNKLDDVEVTSALLKWATRRLGFEYSANCAQVWKFVVEIVDAALWLGWLFPRI